ncbi:MAG: RNA pseudouridine synthase [Chloroflexi bacterium]|nr:MAG: RNA pseudouridine synthase [Chloroflexota bacterium]
MIDPDHTPQPVVRLRVEKDGQGQRLDRWLAAQFPEYSRSALQRWIKDGAVAVDGIPARAGQRLMAGEAIAITLPDAPVAADLRAEAIPLDILYEDADILVINKPAGMVVHPAPGHSAGTLVNAVLHHCPDLAGIGGERRPGIVHRLDKDTSGVMVVAKHERALRHLQAQFKTRQVQKEYLALVEGRLTPQEGRIIAPLGRHPVDRKRQTVIPPSAAGGARSREAITGYRVEAVFTAPVHNDRGIGHFSLVRAHPITGRTHQIRVHLAWRGHPIVGDPLYGLRHQRLATPRLFLHAARLCLRLPDSGEMREFQAPLAPDLRIVLDRLVREA